MAVNAKCVLVLCALLKVANARNHDSTGLVSPAPRLSSLSPIRPRAPPSDPLGIVAVDFDGHFMLLPAKPESVKIGGAAVGVVSYTREEVLGKYEARFPSACLEDGNLPALGGSSATAAHMPRVWEKFEQKYERQLGLSLPGVSKVIHFWTGPNGFSAIASTQLGSTNVGVAYKSSNLDVNCMAGLRTAGWVPTGVHLSVGVQGFVTFKSVCEHVPEAEREATTRLARQHSGVSVAPKNAHELRHLRNFGVAGDMEKNAIRGLGKVMRGLFGGGAKKADGIKADDFSLEELDGDVAGCLSTSTSTKKVKLPKNDENESQTLMDIMSSSEVLNNEAQANTSNMAGVFSGTCESLEQTELEQTELEQTETQSKTLPECIRSVTLDIVIGAGVSVDVEFALPSLEDGTLEFGVKICDNGFKVKINEFGMTVEVCISYNVFFAKLILRVRLQTSLMYQLSVLKNKILAWFKSKFRKVTSKFESKIQKTLPKVSRTCRCEVCKEDFMVVEGEDKPCAKCKVEKFKLPEDMSELQTSRVELCRDAMVNWVKNGTEESAKDLNFQLDRLQAIASKKIDVVVTANREMKRCGTGHKLTNAPLDQKTNTKRDRKDKEVKVYASGHEHSVRAKEVQSWRIVVSGAENRYDRFKELFSPSLRGMGGTGSDSESRRCVVNPRQRK